MNDLHSLIQQLFDNRFDDATLKEIDRRLKRLDKIEKAMTKKAQVFIIDLGEDND